LAGFAVETTHDVGEDAGRRDRNEILQGIVARRLVETHVEDGGALRGKQQRVAVGRSPRAFGGAQQAAGATLIVDDDRLAERLRELLTERPADRIGTGARGEGDDQPDWAVRPFCRHRRAGCEHRRAEEQRPREGVPACQNLA